MKNVSEKQKKLIAEAYVETRERIITYIANRINDRAEAEDLTQDVFVRLLEYGAAVSPATVTGLIYTVARNITFDYLRHNYCRAEAEACISDRLSESVDSDESEIIARDIEALELRFVSKLPNKRQTVYRLSRFNGMSAADIAAYHTLSIRTVENHLHLARTEIRGRMSRLLCV